MIECTTGLLWGAGYMSAHVQVGSLTRMRASHLTDEALYAPVHILKTVRRECELLGMRSSVAQLNTIEETVLGWKGDEMDVEVLNRLFTDLTTRMIDELREQKFLAVELRDHSYYTQPTPLWGEKIAMAFADANLSEDIDEAGKCIALSRFTAAVFHLMRVLDAALERLAKWAGVGDVKNPNWAIKIKAIDDITKAIPQADARRTAWDETRAFMLAIKDAWRNPTIHPKKTYTGDEARHIFAITQSFLGKLSDLVALPSPKVEE